nr:hypothetical protein [Acinetobacter baumannii]
MAFQEQAGTARRTCFAQYRSGRTARSTNCR